MKMKLKNEKGITLVALVVTIIVLIILATVSINLVMGDEGIIRQAEKAAEAQANAEKSTTTALANYANIIAEAMEENDEDEEEELEPELNEHGFYFNMPYSVTLGNNKMSVVIKSDGSSENYFNNYLDSVYPAETFTFSNKTLTANGIDCTVSEDGKTVSIPQALAQLMSGINAPLQVTCSFEKYHDVYYGEEYHLDLSEVGDSFDFFESPSIGASVVFYADGSIRKGSVDQMVYHYASAGSAEYSQGHMIRIPDETEYNNPESSGTQVSDGEVIIRVSMDGSKLECEFNDTSVLIYSKDVPSVAEQIGD